MPHSHCSRRISTNNSRTCFSAISTTCSFSPESRSWPVIYFLTLYYLLSLPCIVTVTLHPVRSTGRNLLTHLYGTVTSHVAAGTEMASDQWATSKWGIGPSVTHRQTAEDDEKNCILNFISVWQRVTMTVSFYWLEPRDFRKLPA